MRRRKTRTRWIEGVTLAPQGGGERDFYQVHPANNYSGLLGDSPIPELITAAQVKDELDGNGTILRIVGDIILFNVTSIDTSPREVVIWEAIKVVDEELGTGSGPTFDLSQIQSNDMSWMWTRFTYLESPTSTTPSLAVASDNRFHAPFGPKVDIRVRRRIRKGQALKYYCTFGVPGHVSTNVLEGLYVMPQLRVLCKLN